MIEQQAIAERITGENASYDDKELVKDVKKIVGLTQEIFSVMKILLDKGFMKGIGNGL